MFCLRSTFLGLENFGFRIRLSGNRCVDCEFKLGTLLAWVRVLWAQGLGLIGLIGFRVLALALIEFTHRPRSSSF